MSRKTGFNRSQWAKNRWKIAREQQSLYNEKYKSNTSSREFFKTKNVLTNNIVKYIVTYKMDNKAKDYEFFFPQGSYTIYSLKGLENENQLETNTKNSILSKFIGGQKKFIDDNVIVEVKEHTIRGVEEQPIKYDEVDYELLKFKNTYTNDNPKLEIVKTNKEGNKSIFDYDLDVE